MPTSKARDAFDSNIADIITLKNLHEHANGEAETSAELEVLNKSAIVLLTSFWEAYCEDLAAEALEIIVQNVNDVDVLPKEIRKRVAADLKKEANELAVWKISGDRWRDLLRNRLAALQEERNWKLNTPKHKNIDELFYVAIGLESVSEKWGWSEKGMSAKDSQDKLDELVSLRGEIAHRGKATTIVTKTQVWDYAKFVAKIAAKTGGRVHKHVREATGGVGLWE
ncbi:MAE_28990/MAE_18760 family HEPN-like nuclease [Paraburkholderia aspalathi]|uniref:MAE_28990/MAE_18760 family HEPN-like nuclease n=1 Tax=Paraburkholderia aspalathi TaxID=1324617 RepID=UPI003C8798B8